MKSRPAPAAQPPMRRAPLRPAARPACGDRPTSRAAGRRPGAHNRRDGEAMKRIREWFEKPAATLLLCGLALALPSGALAAGGARSVIDYIDVSKTPQFSVYMDYLDAAGRPITKLDAKDLTLLLDGESYSDEIGITPFKQSEEAVAFVILVNNYKAYFSIFDEQKKALGEFVRGMRAKDRAAVLYYSDKVTPQVDFTSDKEELIQAINSVPAPEKPQEMFIDAVVAALDKFPEADPSFPRRRGVVMLSDALDQGLADQNYLQGRIKKDLAPKAKALGVKFYGLGYSVESREGFKLMGGLAKHLGGSFDDVKESEINRMGDKFVRILNLVYGQYIINFNTSDLDSEVAHTLQVNINYQGTL
ncbi:MAG: VWA domain-containing protein, partial [Deltaproteobacteria bacterium]|nr:VWA domain-containing protein [Deltaproteobacteria bacterium]